MVTAIRHRPKAKPVNLREKELSQLKPPMLSINETSEDVECEDLVKIIIGDDSE